MRCTAPRTLTRAQLSRQRVARAGSVTRARRAGGLCRTFDLLRECVLVPAPCTAVARSHTGILAARLPRRKVVPENGHGVRAHAGAPRGTTRLRGTERTIPFPLSTRPCRSTRPACSLPRCASLAAQPGTPAAVLARAVERAVAGERRQRQGAPQAAAGGRAGLAMRGQRAKGPNGRASGTMGKGRGGAYILKPSLMARARSSALTTISPTCGPCAAVAMAPRGGASPARARARARAFAVLCAGLSRGAGGVSSCLRTIAFSWHM